jgi:hypothetical protein
VTFKTVAEEWLATQKTGHAYKVRNHARKPYWRWPDASPVKQQGCAGDFVTPGRWRWTTSVARYGNKLLACCAVQPEAEVPLRSSAAPVQGASGPFQTKY